ncbi:MAG: hypothetical protein CMJ18_15920 [Phycisphaeraceae bacterium]|nr:hypothetical protein [Phycisphaeraceae bacterium]
MKWLIVNTDYTAFLDWLYRRHAGLENAPYAEQLARRDESLFATADFYSTNLRRLGHEAVDVHANNLRLQSAWAREHGIAAPRSETWGFRMRRGVVPWVERSPSDRWIYRTLAAQIRHHRPDVLLCHDLNLSRDFFRRMKPHVGTLVGQFAAPLPPDCEDLPVYDLLLSSLPSYVERFRAMGIAARQLPFAFDSRVLDRVGRPARSIDVSFIGSIFRVHASRRRWLEAVTARAPITAWCPDRHGLKQEEIPRCRVQGSAWGVEMYRVLAASRITLNHHIDLAGNFANNMRLFEATGAGCLLITDHKFNLHEWFEPDREVVTYRGAEHCAELIRYFLEHEDERRAIAEAGQRRTLADHSYLRRMEQLVDIVEHHRRRKSRRPPTGATARRIGFPRKQAA